MDTIADISDQILKILRHRIPHQTDVSKVHYEIMAIVRSHLDFLYPQWKIIKKEGE